MKRAAVVVLTALAGLAVLAMVSHRSPPPAATARAPHATPPDRSASSTPPAAARARATRWTCAVRHARTGHYYRCTEGDETKACHCAIRKCKHWNPGQQRHCSSLCKCKKE